MYAIALLLVVAGAWIYIPRLMSRHAFDRIAERLHQAEFAYPAKRFARERAEQGK